MKYCPQCTTAFEIRLLDGVERKVCSNTNCHFVVWDNPIPVVAGLVIYHDKLLLARNSAWLEGVYSMIAGYLERHESPEEAIVRETKEELGLDVCELTFIGHYPFVDKNQIIMAFALRATGELKLNHEIADIEVLELEQLAQKDFGELVVTARVVSDWLRTK